MRITIEGASEEFERKLLDLLAEHRDELAVSVETVWDVDRAMLFLNTLNVSARLFVRLVVESDGHLEAAVLREVFPRGLRGPAVALANALKRGVKHGWWPEGTEAPVTVVYGGGPQDGWRQASAYEMSGEVLAVFRAALAHCGLAPRPAWGEEDAPSAFAVHPSWAADADVPRALADEPPTTPNFPDGAAR
ncbi:hypothetical protein ACTWP5_28640 [Streptomyces sp. 4N509B]|uniref:hypothetical protein n=1 Tax=Streptomyces sp. 4N509B TaxID=3457413 RepID=UPI003FD09AEB